MRNKNESYHFKITSMNTIKKIIRTSFFLLATCLISCNKKPLCDIPEEITYTNQIATLIEEKCFMCHAEDVYKTKASRNKIFDYDNLKKMGESGQLVGSITHAKGYIPMPYRKGTKIDTCAIELIKKWVDLGMKE